MDTDYWANQICSPARFFDAAQAAISAARTDYVAEAGPRPTLLTLARRCGLPPQTRSLTLCGGPDSDGTELLGVAATLLRDGYSPDLSPLYGQAAGPLHRIPPYVFDTSSRFWFDGGVAAPAPTAQPAMATPIAERKQSAQVPAGPEHTVLALIADVGGYSAGEIARSSRLSDDLGYDSLLQLRLFDRLRAEYPQLGHVAVVEVLPNIHSVGDVVDFVVQRLALAPAWSDDTRRVGVLPPRRRRVSVVSSVAPGAGGYGHRGGSYDGDTARPGVAPRRAALRRRQRLRAGPGR